jgi:hypothetical protein
VGALSELVREALRQYEQKQEAPINYDLIAALRAVQNGASGPALERCRGHGHSPKKDKKTKQPVRKSRLRVAIDTNVLISAAIKPQGWQTLVEVFESRSRGRNQCVSQDAATGSSVAWRAVRRGVVRVR